MIENKKPWPEYHPDASPIPNPWLRGAGVVINSVSDKDAIHRAFLQCVFAGHSWHFSAGNSGSEQWQSGCEPVAYHAFAFKSMIPI